MDVYAMYVGYCVIVAASFSLAAFLLGAACSQMWHRIQNAYGLYEVVEAVKKQRLEKKGGDK